MKATAKAHTNIALIKYWGKRNEELILPTNNSLSLTLDSFYTTTTVHFQDNLEEDTFILDHEEVSGESYERVTEFLDFIRHYAKKPDLYAEVKSYNNVPTAAGLASSASGFAALAAASTRALGLKVSDEELSRITRRGSGSACRSVYGGFAEWEKGTKEDGSDCYAIQIAPKEHWDIRMATVLLSSTKKDISSRDGMKSTVDTSVFYSGWLNSVPDDLQQIKEGIRSRDFEKVGQIAEANCLKMHATTLGANPPFIYWHDTTMAVMEKVREMRLLGIPVYFTIDAGPNVKVLYLPEHESAVQKSLGEVSGVNDVILSKSGKGITYL